MKLKTRSYLSPAFFLLGLGVTALHPVVASEQSRPSESRFLYVAVPGIRDYLEYGGHGVLVFDIDHGHKWVKRIPARGLDENGKPLNVKGVCASGATRRLYVSTVRSLTCLDLASEQVL